MALGPLLLGACSFGFDAMPPDNDTALPFEDTATPDSVETGDSAADTADTPTDTGTPVDPFEALCDPTRTYTRHEIMPLMHELGSECIPGTSCETYAPPLAATIDTKMNAWGTDFATGGAEMTVAIRKQELESQDAAGETNGITQLMEVAVAPGDRRANLQAWLDDTALFMPETDSFASNAGFLLKEGEAVVMPIAMGNHATDLPANEDIGQHALSVFQMDLLEPDTGVWLHDGLYPRADWTGAEAFENLATGFYCMANGLLRDEGNLIHYPEL